LRLFIDYKLTDSGKGNFLRRLMPALENIGVKCVKKKADVALGISKWKSNPKGLPRVLRVDGAHVWNTGRNRWVNKNIKKGIKSSDLVIWQSKFAGRMVPVLLKCQPENSCIIYNGANPNDFNVPLIKKPRPKMVILSSRWKTRPQKRLRESLKIAKILMKQRKDVGFWLAGKTDKKTKQDGVYVLGHLDQKTLARYLRTADVMLAIPWYDWCPNAVVEALVAGCPVVCNNGSGTEEIVGDVGGIVCPVDKPLKFKMVGDIKPPKIDRQPILDALNKILDSPYRVNKPELFIENIALQYKKAFESACGLD